MSFDLTNKNISDTFQNLLQKTGSDSSLYDLEGNKVTSLKIDGALTASGDISASAGIVLGGVRRTTWPSGGGGGGGSGAVDSIANGADNRLVTFSDEDSLNGEANLSFNGNNLSVTGSITVTGDILPNAGSTQDIGSATKPFKSVFVSSQSLHIVSSSETTTLSYQQGELKINNPVSSSGFVGDLTGDVTGDLTGTASFATTASSALSALTAQVAESATNVFSTMSIFSGVSSTDILADSNTDRLIVSGTKNQITITPTAGTDTMVFSVSDNLSLTSITASGNISSSNGNITSRGIEVHTNDASDCFLIKSGSLESLKVNGQGVLTLGGFTFTPTAVRGGMYYDNDDDEFYLGKNN